MHRLKLKLLGIVAGAILGLGGIAVLSASLVVLLSEFIGLAGALGIVGVGLAVISAACVFVCVRPSNALMDDLQRLQEQAVTTLKQAPVAAITSAARSRPVTTASLSFLAGYSVVRNPQLATQNLHYLVRTLL